MSKYTCSCGKQYIRQDAFKRHETMCKLMYNCSQGTIEPTNAELYTMIVNLMGKYQHLQREYDKLKSIITKAKRDFDIVQHLKDNYKCNQEFIDFIKSTEFKIDVHEFEYICDKGYSKGVLDLLLRYFKTCDNIPICAFDIKLNKIYVYIGGEWSIVDNDIQRQMFNAIDVKVFDGFKMWKNYYENKMDQDIFSEMYIKNMKKIMVDIEIKNKMMLRLYKNIVINVKDFVK